MENGKTLNYFSGIYDVDNVMNTSLCSEFYPVLLVFSVC